MKIFGGNGQSVRWRTAWLPLVILASGIGHLVAGINGFLEPVTSVPLVILQSAAVALQSLALLFRHTAPVPVFAVVVLLHTGLLATSGAELGIGSLAVIVGAFHLVRQVKRPRSYRVLAALASISSAVALMAALLAGSLPLIVALALVLARLLLEFVAPAMVAEFINGRAKLADATRERELFLERERVYLLEQERRAERTALARELHDIAGHHLTGIIVSAQAAGALVESDPARSRALLHELEQEARATMVDLRGTVGLLRPDTDDDGRSTFGIPGLGDLPALVESAVRRGQRVSFTVTGTTVRLGPIAEASIHRTVQESLANAARHAPGAECSVAIEYLEEEVLVTVQNGPSPPTAAVPTEQTLGDGPGYGLVGMNERAELIGADLTTGPTVDGGWRNRLRIPHLARGMRR